VGSNPATCFAIYQLVKKKGTCDIPLLKSV